MTDDEQHERDMERLANETVECWRCGEDRYTYESCMKCGASCKRLKKRKQKADSGERERCDYPGCENDPEHEQEMSDGSTTVRCGTHKLATDLAPPF